MSPTAHSRPRSLLLTTLTLGLIGAVLSGFSAGCTPRPLQSKEPNMSANNEPQPIKTDHAPLNGISMYFEIHGAAAGTPLVLLHGGGSTIDVTYGRVLPFFARHRRVIALEEQGHGRTSDRDAPVRFDTSADDVAALLRHLDIAKADIMGFSNGASMQHFVETRRSSLVETGRGRMLTLAYVSRIRRDQPRELGQSGSSSRSRLLS